MNHYTGYELLWLFFIYSFGGWVLETISATLKQRKFANRGLVNGPFCVLYGLTAIAMTVGLQELRGIWLFIFATVYATVAEWVSGHLIEKAFKARWWDYSNIKWNLDGYICLPASLFWGVLGYLAVRWCNGVTLILLSYSAEVSEAYCAADTDPVYFLWISLVPLCFLPERVRSRSAGLQRMPGWIRSAQKLRERLPEVWKSV